MLKTYFGAHKVVVHATDIPLDSRRNRQAISELGMCLERATPDDKLRPPSGNARR